LIVQGVSKNPEIPKDSLLSFAGGALAQADDIVKFVTNILGFARIVVEKYRKQSRQKEFRLEQIRELRHEMGALGALTKEMERQSRRGVVYPESIKELSIHVRKANKISREMELRGEDP